MQHKEKFQALLDPSYIGSLYNLQFDSITPHVMGINRVFLLRHSNTDFYMKVSLDSFYEEKKASCEHVLLKSYNGPRQTNLISPVENIHSSTYLLAIEDGYPETLIVRLYPGSKGKNLEHRPLDFELLGKSLANIHTFIDADKICDMYDYRDIIKKFAYIASRKKNVGIDTIAPKINSECLRKRIKYISDNDRQVMLHGDFWPGNARLRRGVVDVFDFDDCGLGSPLVDIGTIYWYLAQNNIQTSSYLWQSFMNGYTSITGFKIQDDEVKLFSLLREVRTFNMLLGYDLLNEEMLEYYLRDFLGRLTDIYQLK